MNKFFFTSFLKTFILTSFIFALLFVNLSQIKPVYAQAPGCTLSTGSVAAGGSVTVTSVNSLFGSIGIQGGYGSPVFSGLGNLPAGGTAPVTVPSAAPAGLYVVRVGGYAVACTPNLDVTAAGGGVGVGSGSIGSITPPSGLPSISGDPSSFVAGIVQAAISLLIIVAFIVDLLWTMFAGFRFITAGGDSKTVGQAWSQIYWGLIGMVVVLGSFAIIKLVETFFGVTIISGGFQLPTI